MKLFLDSSVILAASGRATGASRAIIERAADHHWDLLTSDYVVSEVEKNIVKLPGDAHVVWKQFQPKLKLVRDVFTLDRPVIFAASKDRPILFTAAAYADVLLTLDRRDFNELIGSTFYGLPITKPGDWLANHS